MVSTFHHGHLCSPFLVCSNVKFEVTLDQRDYREVMLYLTRVLNLVFLDLSIVAERAKPGHRDYLPHDRLYQSCFPVRVYLRPEDVKFHLYFCTVRHSICHFCYPESRRAASFYMCRYLCGIFIRRMHADI